MPDPEMRNVIGRFYISINSLMILVLILLILIGSFKIGKLVLKKYKNRWIHKHKMAERKVTNKEDGSR